MRKTPIKTENEKQIIKRENIRKIYEVARRKNPADHFRTFDATGSSNTKIAKVLMATGVTLFKIGVAVEFSEVGGGEARLAVKAIGVLRNQKLQIAELTKFDQ